MRAGRPLEFVSGCRTSKPAALRRGEEVSKLLVEPCLAGHVALIVRDMESRADLETRKHRASKTHAVWVFANVHSELASRLQLAASTDLAALAKLGVDPDRTAPHIKVFVLAGQDASVPFLETRQW